MSADLRAAAPATPDPPLPPGFRIELDPTCRQIRTDLWRGGTPTRTLRLTAAGARALAELRSGPVHDASTGRLARRFSDAGLAHPVPPPLPVGPPVTVVVPVHERAAELERCLAALGRRHRVIVVDDASDDAAGIAAVAARSNAELARLTVNGGPGAARNAGLQRADTDLVAFVDSDTVPAGDWIAELAAHLADPALAAAAPRIIAQAPATVAGRYTQARSSLDLGTRPALVAPYSPVSYVPTAALVCRRDALLDAGGFDPSLRVGEDVDLVWRLCAAGRRVRYVPSAEVAHTEPESWRALLSRRYRYGTSAAPLALRHPDRVAPFVAHPWSCAAAAAALGGRPAAAAAALGSSALSIRRARRQAQLPVAGSTRTALSAAAQTWLGLGRVAAQFAAPLALTAALRSTGPARRAAWTALLLAPPAEAYLARRPQLDPVRYAAAHLADDIAYGAGVLAGCLRHRTARPLTPRPFRTAPRS